MTYHNAPLTGSLQLPMQIIQGRNFRSDLPLSNAARIQLGIQPEIMRNSDKHVVLPTYDHHVGQQVMYQDSTSKCWYPAVIESLCPKTRTYKITTREGISYRKTQAHLKPLTLQNKNLQSDECVSPLMAQSNHMWPVKQSDHKKSQVNNNPHKYTKADLKETLSP